MLNRREVYQQVYAMPGVHFEQHGKLFDNMGWEVDGRGNIIDPDYEPEEIESPKESEPEVDTITLPPLDDEPKTDIAFIAVHHDFSRIYIRVNNRFIFSQAGNRQRDRFKPFCLGLEFPDNVIQFFFRVNLGHTESSDFLFRITEQFTYSGIGEFKPSLLQIRDEYSLRGAFE